MLVKLTPVQNSTTVANFTNILRAFLSQYSFGENVQTQTDSKGKLWKNTFVQLAPRKMLVKLRPVEVVKLKEHFNPLHLSSGALQQREKLFYFALILFLIVTFLKFIFTV